MSSWVRTCTLSSILQKNIFNCDSNLRRKRWTLGPAGAGSLDVREKKFYTLRTCSENTKAEEIDKVCLDNNILNWKENKNQTSEFNVWRSWEQTKSDLVAVLVCQVKSSTDIAQHWPDNSWGGNPTKKTPSLHFPRITGVSLFPQKYSFLLGVFDEWS